MLSLKRILPGLFVCFILASCSGQDASAQKSKLKPEFDLIGKKEYEKAVSGFEKAISSDEKNPYAWYGRGLAHAGVGKLELAIADYDQAIILLAENKTIEDTAKARIYFERGLNHFALTHYDPAIADFTEAINRKFAKTADAFAYRGVCYGRKEDFSNVFKDLNHAISMDPKNHYAITNRGYYNSLVGDNAAAIKDHTMAIEIMPDDKMSYLNRGYTYLQDGNVNRALEDFMASYKIDSTYMGAIVYVGIAKTNLGDNAGALPWFNKVIPMQPDNPTLYYYRGTCLANLGRTEEACPDLRKAAELGESNALPLVAKFCK
jgi:tetratricopeptide (TPR) repeat protein